MDIGSLLDQLEDLGDAGDKWYHHLLPSFNRTCINAEQFFDTINKIRASLPEEVRTAEEITQQRERVLEEAHEERAKIIEAAKQQSELLVSNDTVVQEARRRAEEIIRQARIEAEGLRADADEYARTVLDRLEAALERSIATIRKGREALDTGEPAAEQGQDED